MSNQFNFQHFQWYRKFVEKIFGFCKIRKSNKKDVRSLCVRERKMLIMFGVDTVAFEEDSPTTSLCLLNFFLLKICHYCVNKIVDCAVCLLNPVILLALVVCLIRKFKRNRHTAERNISLRKSQWQEFHIDWLHAKALIPLFYCCKHTESFHFFLPLSRIVFALVLFHQSSWICQSMMRRCCCLFYIFNSEIIKGHEVFNYISFYRSMLFFNTSTFDFSYNSLHWFEHSQGIKANDHFCIIAWLKIFNLFLIILFRREAMDFWARNDVSSRE